MFLLVTSDLDVEMQKSSYLDSLSPKTIKKEVLCDKLCHLLTKLANRPIYDGHFGRHLEYRVLPNSILKVLMYDSKYTIGWVKISQNLIGVISCIKWSRDN